MNAPAPITTPIARLSPIRPHPPVPPHSVASALFVAAGLWFDEALGALHEACGALYTDADAAYLLRRLQADMAYGCTETSYARHVAAVFDAGAVVEALRRAAERVQAPGVELTLERIAAAVEDLER